MSLDTKVSLTLESRLSSGLDLNATAQALLSLSKQLRLSDGTGADQANQLWFDTRQIAVSGTDDLDLSGVLVNALGATVAFARVKLMYVFAYASNTNNVLIGGGTNPLVNWVGAAGDIVVVTPGGIHWLYAPNATAYAVTAGTGDILRIANSGAGTVVDYDIVLIGSTV